MANEIQFGGPGVGAICYCVIRDNTGRPWSTSGGVGGFAAFLSGSWADYVIQSTEQGVDNYFTSTMPAAIPAGVYAVSAHQQVAVSPAQTDPRVAAGDVQWNGTRLAPLSDAATSGQIAQFLPTRMARGEMVPNFPFLLVSSLDHVTPLVSGIVSGQISRNGGAFGPLQSGNVSEIGLGFYSVTLTSGDLLANTAALIFTAVSVSGVGSDQRSFSLLLQRTSGQQVT